MVCVWGGRGGGFGASSRFIHLPGLNALLGALFATSLLGDRLLRGHDGLLFSGLGSHDNGFKFFGLRCECAVTLGYRMLVIVTDHEIYEVCHIDQSNVASQGMVRI